VDELQKLIPPGQRKDLDKSIKDLSDQAARFRKAVKQASKPQGAQGTPGAPSGSGAPAPNPFENPLASPGGGLGGTGFGG
jgi:hypothetical protein